MVWCSGYDCTFPVRVISVQNLWIANFWFSFYGVSVQNQWVHKTLKSWLRTLTLAIQVWLPLVRIEYKFPFQIWYGELCVKKPMKVRQKALFWFLILFFSGFLSVSTFLKIWANHFCLLTFESFKVSLTVYLLSHSCWTAIFNCPP